MYTTKTYMDSISKIIEHYHICKKDSETSSNPIVLGDADTPLDSNINLSPLKTNDIIISISDMCMDIHRCQPNGVEVIHVDFKQMLVEKRSMPFDNSELKLFDSLEFDLSKDYKARTKQRIEDWIYDD